MTTGESITGFDFFEAGELPVPLVSTELAERWAQEAFGLVVRAVDLGSQQARSEQRQRYSQPQPATGSEHRHSEYPAQ